MSVLANVQNKPRLWYLG